MIMIDSIQSFPCHWYLSLSQYLVKYMQFTQRMSFLPPTNKVWGKIIFSQVSVILFTGGHVWQAPTPCHAHPLPHTPPCHACPTPSMPPTTYAHPSTHNLPCTHAPCHASPLPYMPPSPRILCFVHFDVVNEQAVFFSESAVGFT